MKILLWTGLMLSLCVSAHDEGHGPKITDGGKQGGVVAPVVLAKDAELGAKAKLVYKAELVRYADNKIRVYFYDKSMQPLKVGSVSKVLGKLQSGKKGKVTEQKFDFKVEKDHFLGQSPKPTRKPYNIDITVTEGERELLAAFDNLD